jgi:hypothetical protein
MQNLPPGIVVPSSEQKQSGKTHTAGSHGGARLGSVSLSTNENKNKFTLKIQQCVLNMQENVKVK